MTEKLPIKDRLPVRDSTDVHFGLIPLDPARNNDVIEPRYVLHPTPSQNLAAITDGDSWVEWGEGREYDPEQAPDAMGRFYGAPGLHVIVRIPALEPLPEATYLRPTEYLAGDRTMHLAGLAKRVVEEQFADLLADGYRISDYAAVTDATDWAEAPTWDPRPKPVDKVVTFYA